MTNTDHTTRAQTAATEDKCTATRARAPFKFEWEIELELIAQKHSVPLAALREKGRSKLLVAARKDCYRYLRDQREWSLPQIGKYFNRDHSTIIHSLRSDEDREALNADRARRIRLARQWGVQ